MDDWETLCAICGSSTGYHHDVSLGRQDPDALKRRREVVRKRQQVLKGGGLCDWDELTISDLQDDSEGGDMETSHASYEDDGGYDPELVDNDRTWLNNMRCLAFNEHSRVDSKVWLSGEGMTSRYGQYVVHHTIDLTDPFLDRNLSDEENIILGVSLSCYRTDQEETIPVIPFHACCLEILARFLTGSTDINALLNKETLYYALLDVAGKQCLDFDYKVRGQARFWYCIPGEEFSVAYPLVILGLPEFLRAQMLNNDEKGAPCDNLEPKVSSDSMTKLPPELLHEILRYLSAQDILAFSTASLMVLRATNTNRFWKERTRCDMPWFWELDDLIEEAQSRNMNLDCKRLYLWLKMTTRELFGNDSPFLGLVNRSRIWEVCERFIR